MKQFFPLGVAVMTLGVLVAPVLAADSYKVDPVHSSNAFRIKHANAAYFHGRFNETAGSFTLDSADPTQASFNVEISAASVDTNNEKRDGHLKSADFFNVKQYPAITFKSTSVEKGEGENTLAVTGDLTMHGVTKSVTIPVQLTGTGEFPQGVHRAGVEATFEVKMSDFGIKGMPGALSDEVRVVVSLEGVKEG